MNELLTDPNLGTNARMLLVAIGALSAVVVFLFLRGEKLQGRMDALQEKRADEKIDFMERQIATNNDVSVILNRITEHLERRGN